MVQPRFRLKRGGLGRCLWCRFLASVFCATTISTTAETAKYRIHHAIPFGNGSCYIGLTIDAPKSTSQFDDSSHLGLSQRFQSHVVHIAPKCSSNPRVATGEQRNVGRTHAPLPAQRANRWQTG